jgi:hypothetical protein
LPVHVLQILAQEPMCNPEKNGDLHLMAVAVAIEIVMHHKIVTRWSEQTLGFATCQVERRHSCHHRAVAWGMASNSALVIIGREHICWLHVL